MTVRPFALAALLAAIPAASFAQDAGAPDPRLPSITALERSIVTREPETRVASPDHDRITARRIDIVDENGTIRLSLAAPTAPPIIDGVQYKRVFDVSGLVIYDENGSERGGLGVADVEGGAAVLALDHPAMDAIGWRVMPDGAVSFSINQAPPLLRHPGLDGKLAPGVATSTRVKISVAADGQPAVALQDAQDRPRLRLTVTDEGYGAIEFLNAEGQVVQTIAPERDLAGR